VDAKIDLLREFSRGFTPDSAKIESAQCGFRFLDGLLSGGARLEYGELTPLRLVHRYKLVDIPRYRMVELLRAHVDKEFNVCLYFDPCANDTFCFNLDNNHRENNTLVIPEMTSAVRSLRQCLCDVGCEPLIVASGRGFHVWCRLTRPVENDRLHRFMLQAAAMALRSVHYEGRNHNNIKINLYPHTQLRNVVSLRLFGSNHVKSGLFSHVWTVDGVLGEDASWERFEDFVRNRQASVAQFDASCEMLASLAAKGNSTPTESATSLA
jgi:hypothetical protein